MSDQEFDAVGRTADISFKVREALRKSLPAPAEQFFHVMVPGKVVNFADYSEGFDADGDATVPVLPTITELNQAILCDDMPALAPVQLGPTGKSVARSYDAAISKLIPAGTTVGVDVVDPKNLSTEEARYKKAMDWLTWRDREQGNKTRVEIYAEKQSAYTKAVEAKIKAFNEALEKATNDPRNATNAEKRAAYDLWVSENARTYRNFMQAAYMDWVVSGDKEEVEYWFSVVDRGSAMARIESSKEAMRFATVQDSDGSVEYNKVKLTPSNWAVIAKNKAVSGKNSLRTVEWYTWEINRLKQTNSMLKAITGKPPVTPPVADPDQAANEAAVDTAMSTFVTKRDAYQSTLSKKGATEAEKKTAQDEYAEARKQLSEAEAKSNKGNVQSLTALNQTAQAGMAENLKSDANSTIATNEGTITQYEEARKVLLDKKNGSSFTGVAEDAGIPAPQPDPQAQSPTESEEDYFTSITVEISSSSSQSSESSHASSASFGASVGWGLFNASASASHSSSESDAASSMAKNDCKIQFECMRVDIGRSWLRGELFYDADLTIGPNEFISPGFGKLQALMEGATPGTKESLEAELNRYSTFPLYPTAFLLAANVVLEFTGETSSIQSHFETSSTSASASVGYGPFSVSSSYSSTDSAAESSCEATSNGCRITIKSPQIIGWVSQMIPALPRLTAATAA